MILVLWKSRLGGQKCW